MKTIYFTIFMTVAFIFNVKAQYVFNGCNTHAVYGDSLIGTSTYYDTTGFNSGSGGANITWDYSNLIIDTTGSLSHYYYDPATTPGSSNFPGAGLADLTPVGQYTYSTYSSDSTTILGVWDASLNCATSLYSDPQKLTCPFAFGNSMTDNYSGLGSCGAVNIYGTRTYMYDGYGTLILPMATYTNVTRAKIIDISTAGAASSIDTFYVWSDVNTEQAVFMYIYMKSITYNFVYKILESFSYSHVPAMVTNVQSIPIDQRFGITVYPNPFSTSAILDISNLDKIKNYELRFSIYDLLGNEGFQSVIHNPPFEINRGNLPNGMYFYKISGGQGIIGTGKLVIQ
ncbi:MAG: T9SS type A sorting domain-containing protein [Bacteroidia bacterium]|nr:T9SS type A sorting domain-containing protein [Bacteroidia bacterium]